MLYHELGFEGELSDREKFIVQMWVNTLREVGWSHGKIRKNILPTLDFIRSHPDLPDAMTPAGARRLLRLGPDVQEVSK